MTTLFRRYPSRDAALDAVAAALPGAVSAATEDHPRGFVLAGLRPSGERWDMQTSAVLAPTGKMLSSPGGGPQIAESAPTGEIDVALYWQGDDAPDLAGEAPAQSLAPHFVQPEAAPAAPAAAPVPEQISDRQFAQGLALRGLITQEEALGWVSTGALPGPILTFLEGLPADAQFGARMLLQGATTFERCHHMTAMFGQATAMDDAALDDFWRFCSSL